MTTSMRRRAVVAAVTAAVIGAGGFAAAPTALADGHTPVAPAQTVTDVVAKAKCKNTPNTDWRTETTVSGLRFRTASGTVRGQLGKAGTDVYSHCTKSGTWTYVTVLQGKWKGKKGYVAEKYLASKMHW